MLGDQEPIYRKVLLLRMSRKRTKSEIERVAENHPIPHHPEKDAESAQETKSEDISLRFPPALVTPGEDE